MGSEGASAAGPSLDAPVSLRQRRRVELRAQLTTTATQMFLAHGFEAVTVTDVARACGVTEKTVFNHFPSKEALLVDRWEAIIDALRSRLADPATTLVDAVLVVLYAELDYLTERGSATDETMDRVRTFGRVLRSSGTLIAHTQRQHQRLKAAALTVVAERLRVAGDDPEAQITVEALTGLFPVFYQSLYRHVGAHRSAARCRTGVRKDTRRAADLLRAGIAD